jgi:hypothetical protein
MLDKHKDGSMLHKRLTDAEVLVVYSLKGLEGQYDLAKRLKVDHKTIAQIWTGRSYRWLTGHAA